MAMRACALTGAANGLVDVGVRRKVSSSLRRVRHSISLHTDIQTTTTRLQAAKDNGIEPLWIRRPRINESQ